MYLSCFALPLHWLAPSIFGTLEALLVSQGSIKLKKAWNCAMFFLPHFFVDWTHFLGGIRLWIVFEFLGDFVFCIHNTLTHSWIGNSRAKKLFQNSIGKIFVSSLATSWSKNHYLFIQSSHELSSMNNNAHAMCTIKQRVFFHASKAFIFCIAFPVLPFLRGNHGMAWG